MTESKSFQLGNYARSVLSNIERLQAEVDRLRLRIEELQRIASHIEVLNSELANAKFDIKKIQKDLESISTDFQQCQLQSVRNGGEEKMQRALLGKDVARLATNRSTIIAAIVSVIVAIVVLAIEKLL